MDSLSRGGHSISGTMPGPAATAAAGGWDGLSHTADLTMPGAIDAGWFEWTLDLTPRQIREIHERRVLLRRLSGYPWPEVRPLPEALPALLADAARWPLFTRALARVAASAVPNLRKRSEFRLFKPELSQPVGWPLSARALETALDSRGVLHARDRLLTAAMTFGLEQDTVQAARAVERSELTEVLPYVEGIMDLIGSLEWERDCLMLPRRPIANHLARHGGAAVTLLPADTAEEVAPVKNEVIPVQAGIPDQEPDAMLISELTTELPIVAEPDQGISPGEVERQPLQVSIPGPSTPVPAAEREVRLGAARQGWNRELRDLGRAASRLSRGTPDPQALRELATRLDKADAAGTAWSDALPSPISVSPLLGQISALAERVVSMAGPMAAWPPRGWNPQALIDADALDGLVERVHAVEKTVRDAEIERDAAVDLMRRGDLSNLSEVNARVQASEGLAFAALTELQDLSDAVRHGSGPNEPRTALSVSDPEPPSASDVWWALPGPSGFLTTALRHAVAEGICLVGAPPHLPNDLCVALDGRASELFGLDVDCLDLGAAPPAGGDPIARIAAMLHLDDADADLIGILQHSARAGTLLVISGLTEADWGQMVGPLRAWQRGRRGISGSGMLLMPPVSLPEDQVVLEGFPFVAWRERVSRADMLSFVDRACGSSGPTLIDRVALGMVVELSAWDRSMVEVLSRFSTDVLLDPVQKLQEIFRPDQGMTPRWNLGGADLWDGSWVVHIAALLAQGDVDGLSNRVWRAQVREVFPFVDTVRQGFRRRYRDVLSAALPMTRSFSGRDIVYDTPERLELAEMVSILRPHIGAAELELLQSAQTLRCNVAHYTPGTAAMIKAVSDLWEDLSDGTDLHAAPSP